MTKDLNPLSELASYAVYHILVAFEYSEDAYRFNYNRDFGPNGYQFNAGCGKAAVIVNEFKSSEITFKSAETTWSFYSPTDHRTTSYDGVIEVADRSGFLLTQLLNNITRDFETSITHLTFAWIPVFIGKKANSSDTKTLTPNPMFFHIYNYTQSLSSIEGRLYCFDIVSCYNTHGLSPQFSQLNQITINHKDANTYNTIPTPSSPTSGLKSTMEEDSIKLRARTARLNNSKYMKTVDDVCKSFELGLNAQTTDHKSQLQKYLSVIRNEYAEKIELVREYKQLPIDYSITVSDYYKNKKIDNINLPFERTQIDQNDYGISSLTFPNTFSIQTALMSIMKMSKDIGKDHLELPTRTFKFTTATKRKCDNRYLIHTNINDFISPYNGEASGSVNTGPGNGVITKPIEYTYQDMSGVLSEDNSITGLTYSVAPTFSLKPIESLSDKPDTQAVYADRESVSLRRQNEYADFFQNAFSGNKVLRGVTSNNGLQNAEAASAIAAFNPSQQTLYTLDVVGNPNLLSDINRNPRSVIDNLPGNALIYKNIEFEPMYLKLKVYIIGDKKNNPAKPFYYDGMLHIYKITNYFNPGFFNQRIYCARTSENM